MSRKNKRNRGDWYSSTFWQSANYNQRAYHKNLNLLLSLAINRFKWTGMPATCDVRFFETQLHRQGIATLCHAKGMPDVWQTLIASPQSPFNVYGIPTEWRATGYDDTFYDVTTENGELCYYNWSRTNPWNALEMFARKLAHYERTEDINLTHQHRPLIFIAPQEQKQQLINLLKQVDGNEPAVLGDDKVFADMVSSVTTIDTGVPLLTEDLARSKQNVLNDALLYLGIPHLAFEKGERMIEDEARANTAPTSIMLLDCLQARREFCEKVNERFGFDLHVYFNQDIISDNYNYVNSIEAMAQDGLIADESAGDEND